MRTSPAVSAATSALFTVESHRGLLAWFWAFERRRLAWVGLGVALLLSLTGPVRADDHSHSEGSTVWFQEDCIRGCCSQSGYAPCTYPSCSYKFPKHRTSGRCPPPPESGEGKFGGGGAAGSYSTGILMSIEPEPMSPWGPRPGASPQGGCRDGLDHDWGEEKCGDYSRPFPSKPDCEVAYCDRKCRRCGTNGQSRLDKRGQCAAPAPGDTVLVSTPWGPHPGSGPSDSCPPHDWHGPHCGSWSAVNDHCKVQHCSYQCSKCLTNGRDYSNEDPPNCLGD